MIKFCCLNGIIMNHILEIRFTFLGKIKEYISNKWNLTNSAQVKIPWFYSYYWFFLLQVLQEKKNL